MSLSGANRLVVLDCDGTLVDSQYRIIACMNTAFQAFGLHLPAAADVRAVVGLSLEEAIARLLPPESELVAPLAAVYRRAFLSLRESSPEPEPLYDGAAEAIRRLDAAGFLLGIATGKSRRGLDAVLAAHGLSSHFVTLQTADLHPGKPDPAMLRQAMAEAGAEGMSTVMVGDTTFDMEMARRAGAAAIGVSWGYHPPAALPPAGASAVIDGFGELAGTVVRLIGGPA